MTVAFYSGRRRRAAAALGAVSAGLLVLSACDKPTPLVTVTVGTESVNAEATCYNDGEAIKESEVQKCLTEGTPTKIKFAVDDKVRLGVDPEIAENGWTLLFGAQPVEQEPFKKTYRTIPGNAFFSSQTGETTDKADVNIMETNGTKVIGIYRFQFEKSS
ncbi:DUF2771 domain-containing protein [Streptomyces genisteinicus]|uniref:DUF2771 domain-containing protein n=1 Tax=Streptomyces genisteinicus TaxID=2768068 RepID=A0A7H0HTL3_9ACTN|nr:DUF2771 domain-containing protein [Streptomyces genisteinicus]QNP63879.1 DUF2771 domain-containing protein [Streptomyces genisteinicus]